MASGAPFPLDLPSDVEVVLVNAVLALAFIAVGKFVGALVVSSLERSATAAREKAKASPFHRPHRRDESRDLVQGELPGASESLAVGFLRAGKMGLERVIVALCLCEGWIVPIGKHTLFVGRLPGEHVRTSYDIHRSFGPGATVHRGELAAKASVVASKEEEMIKRDLLRLGLLRSSGTRQLGALVALTFVVMAAGVVGLQASDAEVHGHSVIALVVEAILILLVGLRFIGVGEVSDSGHAYLAWLESVTGALREDVHSGHAHGTNEVACAAALGVDIPPSQHPVSS